jgi:hypothetical protein
LYYRGRLLSDDLETEEQTLKLEIIENLNEIQIWQNVLRASGLELSKDHEELVHGSQVSLYHFEDPEHPELVSLVEAIEKV